VHLHQYRRRFRALEPLSTVKGEEDQYPQQMAWRVSDNHNVHYHNGSCISVKISPAVHVMTIANHMRERHEGNILMHKLHEGAVGELHLRLLDDLEMVEDVVNRWPNEGQDHFLLMMPVEKGSRVAKMDHTGLAAELKSKNTCMCELQELLLQSPRSERKALKQKVEVLEADVEVLADELSTANKLQAKIAELQFLEEQLLQSPRSMQMNKQATNYSFEIKAIIDSSPHLSHLISCDNPGTFMPLSLIEMDEGADRRKNRGSTNCRG